MNVDTPGVVDVLLVEDDPRDAELLTRAIRKQNIANPIHLVTDGAQALDFLFGRGAFAGRGTAHLPRVVLLDLKLPKVGGLDVLKALKSDPLTRSVPVVIVTSSREDPDITTAYALGANSYVVKPVSSDAFMDALSKVGLYWLLVNQAPR